MVRRRQAGVLLRVLDGPPRHDDEGRTLSQRRSSHEGPKWAWPTFLSVVVACLALVVLLASVITPMAEATDRAIADGDLQRRLSDSDDRTKVILELTDLHASWMRLSISWAALEPSRGAYDPVELADLEAATDALNAAGIRVLLSINYPPPWAQDRSFSVPEGGSYPMSVSALDDFGRLGEFLAIALRAAA